MILSAGDSLVASEVPPRGLEPGLHASFLLSVVLPKVFWYSLLRRAMRIGVPTNRNQCTVCNVHGSCRIPSTICGYTIVYTAQPNRDPRESKATANARWYRGYFRWIRIPKAIRRLCTLAFG
jgi:hypothetical protein